MKKRGNIVSSFFIYLTLSLLLFLLSQKGILQGITGVFEQLTIPVQQATYSSFSQVSQKGNKTELEKLKEENKALLAQIARQKEMEKDIKALRDQFDISEPSPKQLVSAHVVGLVSFIPGITAVDQMIIDKGSDDGIKTGDTVVSKDNYVGKILKTSAKVSVVNILAQKDISLTAKTLKTSALGVVKGKGNGEIIIENVVLTDKLEKNDIVVTKGDVDEKGIGISPNLVLGRINTINKRASDVFQKAELESLVDFTKLEMVFIIK